MTTQILYAITTVIVIFLVGFVGYYAWRLAGARKRTDDGLRRLQAFAQREIQSVATGAASADPTGTGSAAAAPGAPAPAAGFERWGSARGAAADGQQSRVYDKRLSLRAVSESPIFIRRTKEGEVTVQLEDRPPMPLKYVLDPATRKVLHEIASQATIDLGPSWAVVATEDDQGRLAITRLM